MISDLKNKKGILQITKYYFEKSNSDQLSAVFSNFFPIYIKNNPVTDVIKYYGYSLHFNEIKEGEPVPEYFMKCKIDDNGIVKFDSFVLTNSFDGGIKL